MQQFTRRPMARRSSCLATRPPSLSTREENPMRKGSTKKNAGIIAAAILTAAIFASAAIANSLVYHPLNPSFGGDPNMYAWLFGLAGAENQTAGGTGGDGTGGV